MPGTFLEFDLYPPDDPAGKISGTGLAAKLATFTVADQLVDAGYVAELFGLGSGFIEIHVDNPDAELIAPRSYVKVRLTDGGFFSEELGGFWLERAELKVLSKRGQVERVVHWEGEGGALGLDRYVLGHSVYATGQTKRGDINVPGKWHWSQEPYGAILVRVLEEGNDHPDDFYEFFDWDFNRNEDSNGNDWLDLDDYEVPIGTSGLKLWSDFLRLGLVAEVDADLRIHAYRKLSEYRQDRHSATFASGKVRFEAGVNIASEMAKRINPSSQRTHVLIEDRIGDYQTFDEDVDGNPIDGVPYMAFLKSTTTADDDAIANMGALHLTYRNQFTDVCKVKHDLGPGGANGEEGYRPAPGGDYWLGDLVTVHSGTGEHDYNEQTIEVAALRYFMQGKDWLVEAELGAQYRNAQQANFQAQIAQTIIQQLASLQLCEPREVTEAGIAFVKCWNLSMTDGDDLTAAHIHALNPNVGDLLLVHIATDSDSTIPTAASGWTAIGSGGSGVNVASRGFWRLYTGTESGSYDFGSGNSLILHVYRGVLASDPIGSINGTGGNSGTMTWPALSGGSAMEVTDGTSWVVAFGHHKSDGDVGHATLSANNVEDRCENNPTGALGVRDNGEHGSWDTNGGVASWASHTLAGLSSDQWQTSVYEIKAGGSAVLNPDAALAELVGTSLKAKRCDDTEHYHATGSDSPTVDDDVEAGFRPGTFWVNDDGEAWIAFDVSAGAADWIPISGGASGPDLSGINFLVGTASGDLSAEIVVGTSPGGELGGTWASPTVDATHSGSAHHTEDHDHDGSPTQKLAGANTHESPDTDSAAGSLHHTIGSGATQAAAGNHAHGGGGAGGTTIGTGTSFPGSPSTDDLFYRTDRDILYFYDGTRWLSVEQFDLGVGWVEAAAALNATTTLARWPVRQDYGIYLVRWAAVTFQSNATPASNNMSVVLARVDVNNTPTTIASFTTSADTQNTWQNHDQAINAVLSSSALHLRTVATEAGSVTGFIIAESIIYRLIG